MPAIARSSWLSWDTSSMVVLVVVTDPPPFFLQKPLFLRRRPSSWTPVNVTVLELAVPVGSPVAAEGAVIGPALVAEDLVPGMDRALVGEPVRPAGAAIRALVGLVADLPRIC